MNKDIEYDKKCGIAIDFIPNEDLGKKFKNAIQLMNCQKNVKNLLNYVIKIKINFIKIWII